jgi:hypothetical protein
MPCFSSPSDGFSVTARATGDAGGESQDAAAAAEKNSFGFPGTDVMILKIICQKWRKNWRF